MESKYKFLKKWEYPQNYCGEDYSEYYSMGIGQSRDSECLERSNFRSALSELGGETETVIVRRAGHWAVGWVEELLIHESDLVALGKAETLAKHLADYPIVDDDDFFDLEDEERRDWAEQSKEDTARTICNHFELGDDIAESPAMIEACYDLQIEHQYDYGLCSSLECNPYHPLDARDLEHIEGALKGCLSNGRADGPAFDLLLSIFDIKRNGA